MIPTLSPSSLDLIALTVLLERLRADAYQLERAPLAEVLLPALLVPKI